MESSFIAIKPDGVQRGLVGPIITRFEQRGYKLVAMKLVSPSKEHLEKHYEDLADKPFYKGLVTCELISHSNSLVDRVRVSVLMTTTDMLSGPICAMVWEGREAVKTGRSELHLWTNFYRGTWLTSLLALLGATNPMASAPGTIRGDYAIVGLSSFVVSSQLIYLGRRPQCLPRLRCCRERQEGD